MKATSKWREVSLVVLTAALSACGGGSSSSSSSSASGPTLSGSFVDAPVAGMSYSASPSGLSGTTDATGTFSFKAGDTVSFTAAGVGIGSAAPSLGSDGAAVVTPLTLTGETAVGATTSPKALAIATFLNALNAASAAKGTASSGAYVVPSGLNLAPALGSQISSSTTASAMVTAINSAASTSIAAPAATDVQSNLQMGVSSAGIAGSVWRGTCTSGCGGGTVFFKPNGEAVGITDDGGVVSGTWTTDTSGNVSMNLVSSRGGSATGTVAAGATSGTLTLTQGSGGTTGLAISQIASGTALTSSYSGLWYVTFTPNATGTAAGLGSGAAVIMAAPNGSIYGITDNGNFITGNWTASSGAGTATGTNGSGQTLNVSFDLSAGTGSVSIGGTTEGTLAFSRTGTFAVVKTSGTGGSIGGNLGSLLLNLTINWANKPTSASSFALDAHVNDASGNRVGSTVKSESTPLNTSGVPTNNTDNIAISYPAGGGASYAVTFGSGTASMNGCTIANGSGSVTDATAGNASSHPTVTVNCQ